MQATIKQATEIRIYNQNNDKSLDAHPSTKGGVCVYLALRWMAAVHTDEQGRFNADSFWDGCIEGRWPEEPRLTGATLSRAVTHMTNEELASKSSAGQVASVRDSAAASLGLKRAASPVATLKGMTEQTGIPTLVNPQFETSGLYLIALREKGSMQGHAVAAAVNTTGEVMIFDPNGGSATFSDAGAAQDFFTDYWLTKKYDRKFGGVVVTQYQEIEAATPEDES